MVGVLAGTIRPPFAERAKSVTPRSISPASRASIELISTPRNGPTAWIAPNCPLPDGMLGSRRTAARVTLGEICLSNSSHFPLMPYSMLENPVALPPGRARLMAKPPPTGSLVFTNTIGTVRVARCSGAMPELPLTKMTSDAGKRFRTVRCRRQEQPDAAHPFRLLRARRERPPAVPPSIVMNSRRFTRSPRRQAREVAKRSSTFDAFFFEALNKRDHLTLFGLGHLELRQGRGGMTKEHVPVAIANPHASVREGHVPAAIVHWSTRARAKKIDEKLLFAHDAVFSAVRPEPPELRIGSEPGQKIIRHCCDCAISTKVFVKGLRQVAHCVLKSVAGRATPAGVVIPSRVYRYRNSGAQPVIGDVSDEKT